MNDDQLKQAVDDRITELMNLLVDKTMPFKRPTVHYYDNRQDAGRAYYQRHSIELNLPMLRDNPTEFLTQTVAHELAHLVKYHATRSTERPHGREWRRIMEHWFGVPASRCHNFSTESSNIRRQQRWVVSCSCPDHTEITTARRNSMLFKGRRYHCRRCGDQIHLTGAQA